MSDQFKSLFKSTIEQKVHFNSCHRNILNKVFLNLFEGQKNPIVLQMN